jgi:hypothetical protein
MATVKVSRTVEVPAQRVWELIADFGDVSWMPAGTQVTVEGEGPGMKRIIAAGDRSIHEVLESRDPEQRTLAYAIPQGVPFPVTGYRSTIRVADADGGCEITWTGSFEPSGATESEAAAAIEGMYGVMIGWVADRAARRD